MLDFEEELKRFEPLTEVNELEESIQKTDLTDIPDIMLELVKGKTPSSVTKRKI